jgi:hypothetical protein
MRGKAYADRRAQYVEFHRHAWPRTFGSPGTTTPEVIMIRTTHPFTRLVELATVALGLLFVAAGQASAQIPLPGPDGTGSVHEASTPAPAGPSVHASISFVQWTMFAAAVLAALMIGAALMHLAQRRHGGLPLIVGQAAARSSS